MIYAARLGLIPASILIVMDTIGIFTILFGDVSRMDMPADGVLILLSFAIGGLILETFAAGFLWLRQPVWASGAVFVLVLMQALGLIGGNLPLLAFTLFMLYFATISLRGAILLSQR